jgi:integrase
MRPGEARRLRLGDLDADGGFLRVAPCKFSPERVIPLHASTVRVLQRYRRARRGLFPLGDHLFVGVTGQPLQDAAVYRVFSRLTADIPATGDRRSLRLMDFRHAFASQWIARWSRRSQPVSHYLLRLARYLGHQDFKSTWWYVSSDPKTLQSAAQSFLRFHEQCHTLP